jgi:hypothetical protein
MKVYVLVSGTAQPGKHREARKAVAATVKYLNASDDFVGEYDGVWPHAGPNSQVCWMCRYGSLADYEKDLEKRANDPEWTRIFEPVNQAVDVEGVTAQIFRVFDA